MTPPDITRTWTWTGNRDIPDWLARRHHWHQDRPVIHTADGPRTLHTGWLAALWTDGVITVGSVTVADRVYGADGLAGRLQRAEARARELERHLREADAENQELAAHNDQTCEAVQRRDAAEGALARVQTALASFDGRSILAIGHSNLDVPTADEVLAAVRAALDGEQPGPAAAQATEPAGVHRYLSTGCWHGDHAYCQSMTGLNGAKRPASCKFCQAACQCGCHGETGQPGPA